MCVYMDIYLSPYLHVCIHMYIYINSHIYIIYIHTYICVRIGTSRKNSFAVRRLEVISKFYLRFSLG